MSTPVVIRGERAHASFRIVRAPCFRRDTALWFWEEFVAGPFMLTDTAWLEVYEGCHA